MHYFRKTLNYSFKLLTIYLNPFDTIKVSPWLIQGFIKGEELFSFYNLTSSLSFIYRQRTNLELTNSLFYAPNWQAVRLNLFTYADKALTNSLLLASDWLSNFRVWFGLRKRFREKSHKMAGRIRLLLQLLGSTPWLMDAYFGSAKHIYFPILYF